MYGSEGIKHVNKGDDEKGREIEQHRNTRDIQVLYLVVSRLDVGCIFPRCSFATQHL